ncbi:MAG: hypothetical protein NWR79_08895 [Saprospiraceae bacterium]|nr:hypothetical protein [Saprospiraceae bacterium]MDP5089675.1 hypothetical protein [Saprospiraceae bacterium]
MKNIAAPFFVFFLLMTFFSCTSIEKLVDSGQYDKAIYFATNKLSGAKVNKVEYVRGLETAFKKVTDKDMAYIEKLKNEGNPESWETILSVYATISNRQESIRPLLPLTDENGKKANFLFVNTNDLEKEAKEQTINFLYSSAKDFLQEARSTKDRIPARKAYDALLRLKNYSARFMDVPQLEREARELGITKILVNVQNYSQAVFPAGLEDEILRLGFRDLDREWQKFDAYPERNREYDLGITLILSNVQVSPGAVSEKSFSEKKEIPDGFQYVLDEKGNVKKDTAGNDIKLPKNKVIEAQILEVFQSKSAGLSGRLEVIDLHTKGVRESRDINAVAIFENRAASFKGDERALTEDTKKRLGNRPAVFPTDAILLLEAARKLRPLVISELRKIRID